MDAGKRKHAWIKIHFYPFWAAFSWLRNSRTPFLSATTTPKPRLPSASCGEAPQSCLGGKKGVLHGQSKCHLRFDGEGLRSSECPVYSHDAFLWVSRSQFLQRPSSLRESRGKKDRGAGAQAILGKVSETRGLAQNQREEEETREQEQGQARGWIHCIWATVISETAVHESQLFNGWNLALAFGHHYMHYSFFFLHII